VNATGFEIKKITVQKNTLADLDPPWVSKLAANPNIEFRV
jgi:hypothetical protein